MNAPEENQALPAVSEQYIHSDIFERLVKDENDLPGMIAYGLYQRRKRQWIQDYQIKHSSFPSPQTVEQYSFGHRDGTLAALRQEADGSLYRFAEAVMNRQVTVMQANALNGRLLEEFASIKKRVGKISGYRHHIVGHIVGFGCLVLLVVLVTLAFKYEPTLRQAAGYFISTKESGKDIEGQ